MNAPSLVIIGAGFGGLALGAELRRRGHHDFSILERAADLGGVWRDNTYPGAACDVPSVLYCLSREPRTDWSRRWAPQREILGYMHDFARREGLLPHLRTGVEVLSGRFDRERAEWRLETRGAGTISARSVVSAVGQLGTPSLPDLPGLGTFSGRRFHSAEWPADLSLRGFRVGVIGSAASAVQLVPEVAKVARELHVFQRSANHVVPRGDRPTTSAERALLERHPRLARARRRLALAAYDLRHAMVAGAPWAERLGTHIARRHLEAQIPDPELRRKLTPTHPLGAKRVLISDDFYPTFLLPHVTLHTDPIERVEPEGLVTHGGGRVPLDVLVFATGFRTTEFLAPMELVGLEGRSLRERWRDGAEAYLGVTVAGFPNLFLLYGPNTNLGHSSILVMLEAQARYVVDLLEQVRARGARFVDVRPDVERRYNEALQAELARTVWARIERSWYQTAAGRITNNWPGTTARYTRLLRHMAPDDYHFHH